MVILSPWILSHRPSPANRDSVFRSKPDFTLTLSPVRTSQPGSS